MKRHFSKLLFFLFIAILATQSSVSAQSKAAKIDSLMKLYSEYGQFNGSILVAEKGKVIYKKGLGYANMEWEIPNKPDTKHRLGSITKQFTAALILQLVEQGKIKLDGTISDYLPDFRKDNGAKVTIHHLLNHTSGTPNYTAQPGFFQNESRNPYSVEKFIKKFCSGDLEFEPGSKFTYSNSGYFLLGAIIEKVTSKAYENVLKEKIFAPLGMKNTGYDHHGVILKNRSTGYVKNLDGYQNSPYLDMSLPYSAGSMYSTAEDLYIWDQALYGNKVLSDKSKKAMFTPGKSNYGYGFGILDVPIGKTKKKTKSIQHGGGINGFSTFIVRLPETKHLVVLLDNTSQGRNLGRIRQGIINILYNQPFDRPKRSIAEMLIKTVEHKNVQAAVKQYQTLKRTYSEKFDFSETQLNTLGYHFLRGKRIKDAIEVFKLNVRAFPKESNPYDSLGEAYLADGNKKLALINYKKASELDPTNRNAANIVKKLAGTEVKIDSKIYDQYIGEYELAPNFIITITKEGEKLMAQATGQGKFELFPESKDNFFVKVVKASVAFERDEKGMVNGLILNQGGRKIPGKRTK